MQERERLLMGFRGATLWPGAPFGLILIKETRAEAVARLPRTSFQEVGVHIRESTHRFRTALLTDLKADTARG